jgi:hypothetical protein
MAEKPQPDPVPVEDPPPHPAEPLQLETPVIATMDKLAHHSRKEDEAAIAALERIEKSMR